MAFFSEIAGRINNFIDRHDNQTFMEGMMASCAIVAISDGKISFSERVRLDNIIEVLDRINVFDPHEAIDLFNLYVERLNGPQGKLEKEKLLAMISRIFKTDHDKATLLKVCWAISEADGKYEKPEYQAVEEIAKSIKVSLKNTYNHF